MLLRDLILRFPYLADSRTAEADAGAAAADDGAGGDDGGGDAAEEGLSIAEAGEAWLGELSEEEKARPFDGAALEEEDDKGEPARKPAVGEPARAADKPAKAGEADGVEITLPGHGERGEEDITVEVDAELAERIQRLQNDAVRARDIKVLRERVDQQQARIDDYNEAMEVDPVGFHLQQMPREQQLEVARALILEHFDTLGPEVDQFLADKEKLFDARKKAFDGRREADTRIKQSREMRAAVRQVVQAVEKLVPAWADMAMAEEFVSDARADLARMSRAGTRVEPALVKRLLARRLALYGFDKPQRQPARGSSDKSQERSGARPVSDRARQIAEAAPVKRAAEAQSRTGKALRLRRAAARQPGAGAGAAPVQSPKIPKDAEQDVASMSKYLRDNIDLKGGWKPRE